MPTKSRGKPLLADRQLSPHVPEEMDAVRRLILELVEARGVTLKAASIAIGRNHAYLQQFVHTQTPKRLKESDREALEEYLGVEKNTLKDPTPGARLTTKGITRSGGEARYSHPLPSVGRRDLPIRGRAAGGGQEFLIIGNGDIRGYVDRPPILEGDLDAFAVATVGSSMEPRYFHGEILHVSTLKPAVVGDFVLIELTNDTALIKRLVRQTPSEIVLEQYNPARTFSLPLDQIRHIYRIVGTAER